MRKPEYDFLNWTSFPSSGKVFTDEARYDAWATWGVSPVIPVTPGRTLKAEVMVKQQNVMYSRSHVHMVGYDGKTWRVMPSIPPVETPIPVGTFDWKKFLLEETIPSDIIAIRVDPAGGAGSPEAPGITWFDNLKIYQDDVLIYSNDFTNWNPYIGAGIGTPIGGVAANLLKEPLGPIVSEAVGAGLGGAVGGLIGLLTAIGVIPIPTIPTFEELAPEMPVGRYQVVG